MSYTAYEVSITTSSLVYPVGSNLYMVCSVNPTPPANSEFRWQCSTGCFADKKVGWLISGTNLNAKDSGSITCSLTVNNVEYHSEPVNLQVV